MRGGAANVRVNHHDRLTVLLMEGSIITVARGQKILPNNSKGPLKNTVSKVAEMGTKNLFINDLMFHDKQILNGVCHEICGYIFISRFEPIWNPDKQAKLFSNLVRSLTLRCENTAESKNEGKKSRVPVPLSCAYRPCRTPLLSLSS